MRKVMLTLIVVGLVFTGAASYAEESEVLFGFENGLGGWEIPDWAYEKPDHVQQSIDQSSAFASEGESSLVMETEFPGGRWTGGIIEIMQFFDWTNYSKLACDLYLPEGGPIGLKASMILTVGDSWKWVEMSRSFDLEPGKWITVSADLMPGSIDWRRIQVDDAFRTDIRKVDIRVTSNNKPAYTGPIYIDNVRVIK